MADIFIKLPLSGGSSVGAFTDLTDVPSSYSGQSLKFVRVNAGETGLEFTTSSASVAWGAITGTLSSQTDLNSALNGKVATSRTISTTAPLSGGGDLTSNRTLSIAQATTSTDGYLSSTDWNTFNNKQDSDAQLTSIAGLSYSGNALKAIRVNAGETGFELATISGGGYSITTVTSTSSSPSDTSGERILLCDAATAGGTITVNLPTAVSNGAKFTVKKIDSGSNTVIIDPNSTQTIDGFTTFTLYSQHDSITFISDNANWRII